MEISLRDILIAAVSSIVALLSSIALWVLNLKKTKAEIEKLTAEKRKIDAETGQITSDRLLRELDRLASINDEQLVLLTLQRSELGTLRAQIVEYAAREQVHAVENAALRRVIDDLKATASPQTIPIAGVLKSAFPAPLINHAENEYDEPPE